VVADWQGADPVKGNHPVSARIAAELAPLFAAQLDANWEELLDDLGPVKRAAVQLYHNRLLAEIPLITELAVNAWLDARGQITLEQFAEMHFPPKA
jgi:hypothetical protein